MKSCKERLSRDKMPRHVAIIMDGNGRWAARHGVERIFGHQHGVEAVRSVVKGAGEVGIQYLTLYAFSTENWNRPQKEVDALMRLLVQAIENETEELKKNNVQLGTIGDLSKLPDDVALKLDECIQALKGNSGLNLILALSYSAKWEITQAARKIAVDVTNGKISLNDIDDKLFGNYLTTSNIPDPELLIRTSGEYRLSNFLLWQVAYSEMYFTEILWPDFRKEHLFEAVLDYQNRERRFGKISEQLFT